MLLRILATKECTADTVIMRNSIVGVDWTEHVQRISEYGDEAAFAELFHYFGPRIKAFLMRGGTDSTLAEECVQDVMATVWHKAKQFDPSRASVSTWIYTIARNRRIDIQRKQRRPEPEELDRRYKEAASQEELIEFQQDCAKLGEALKSLPKAQLEMIERAYFGEMSHNEISEVTGLPLGTIKSRIRLALERLRHQIK